MSARVNRRTATSGLLGVWAAALSGGFSALAEEIPLQAGAGRKFFDALEQPFVTAYADTLIPATDTPGAVAVGVPALLDHMMATWAGAATRSKLRKTLASMRSELDREVGGAFATAAMDDRVRALTTLDARWFAAEPGRPGPYRQLKILVGRLYYATHIGATVELRYQPIPGDWKSDIPFAEVGRSWAV
jgi:hypothetical protein